MKLEELQPKAIFGGILLDSPITVVSVQWYEANALELTYETLDGRLPTSSSPGMTSRTVASICPLRTNPTGQPRF